MMALYHALVERGHNVRISAYHYSEARARYPDYPIRPEAIQHWIFRKSKLLRAMVERKAPMFLRSYRWADIVIACPGGYFNKFYGIRSHLVKLRTVSRMQRHVIVHSQSFGPFTRSEENQLFNMEDHFDVLVARDRLSHETLEDIGMDMARVVKSNDAAFLLDSLPAREPNNKMAVSVRRWNHDDRNEERYRTLVLYICEQMYAEGLDIEFVSTCQGIEGYVDDSELALEIAEELKEMGIPSTVDRNFYRVDELREKLRDYSCVLGTRLHFCILSMLSGVPAFNISYEDKGRECYHYLELDPLSVDYNEPIAKAEFSVLTFRRAFRGMRAVIPDKMAHQQKVANLALDHALEILEFRPRIPDRMIKTRSLERPSQ